MKAKIVPSILDADFSVIENEIKAVEPYVDMIHLDVMDGRFVPNKTFWADFVEKIRRMTKLKLDVHLMIKEPKKHIEEFAKAGSDIITIHVEVFDNADNLRKTIKKIKSMKIKAGVSLNPNTEADEIKEVINDVDLVLVMGVVPGKGGQSFIEKVFKKIKKIRSMNKNIDIEVDGGINPETARKCVEAGANIIVSGSYIYKQEDYKAAIGELKDAVK